MIFLPINEVPGAQEWFLDRNPIDATAGIKGIVAMSDKGIQGMLVFDTWTENSCQVHIAIDSPMSLRAGLVEEGFRYVFEDTGRDILYGITPANNEKALKFNERVGFIEVFRLKDAHERGVDLIIQEVRRENYYGQESSRAA